VVLGLKTALKVGIDSGSGLASKVNATWANKAIKILLPEEAAKGPGCRAAGGRNM